jgi:hypothetical protein
MTALKSLFMADTAAGIEASFDIGRVERFRASLSGPLAIVASGGSFTAALLWAHLHEAAGYPAWPLTPYAFAGRRLPSDTRVLLLSHGGTHHDILRTADLARERGHLTYAATCREDSPLAERVIAHAGPHTVFATSEPRHQDGLIAVHAIVAFAVLAARVYAGAGPWAPCFEGATVTMPDAQPRFVVAFGSGVAEAAAVDFANKCHETGLAPAWHTDVRHFAHGQWMSLQGSDPDMLLVAFTTRAQRAYFERFSATLPPSIQRRHITADAEGVNAGLLLLAHSIRSFDEMATRGRGAPTIDLIPGWCRALYDLEP